MCYNKLFAYFLNILRIILCWIMKMGNNNNKPVEPYVFKMFKYEEVVPNQCVRVTPLPRSGHRIVSSSQNLYSFGGYNPSVRYYDDDPRTEDEYSVRSFPLFQELWKFNYARRKWTRFSSQQTLPQELASNAVVLHGNYLMVYGGTGSPFGYRCSNQLYICNLKKGSMCEITTTGKHPLPQYGQALVYHNDYLYTIGGTTGFSYTCDIHRLNLHSLKWEIVYICDGSGSYEPNGRYRHEVAFDGKNIYVLGGGTAEEAFGFRDVPVFNIDKCLWYKQRTLKDPKEGYPAARRCHGAVQIETPTGIQVFITGGYDGENVFSDLWKLDVSSFQWTLINDCKLPRPTYFHSTAVSPEGKLYVFGGICANNSIWRTNKIYSAWVSIPKLSEMCWEAILHYSPQLVCCNKDALINMGLPRNFLNRLE